MSRRILALAVPSAFLALLGTGLVAGGQAGFIPRPVLNYLWPGLVALAFLMFCLVALFLRGRRWLWPLGTGFVVQTLGILLYAFKALESPWQILMYTLVAVGVVLLVMLILWIVLTLRSRYLERHLIEGLGGDVDVGKEELQKIRDNMMEALELLRRAGGGRHAIYELPWFLVTGRSQAGKTVAIKNSGLGLPVRKDWVKGVGGTHTANWFFTKDLIFLDTPGKWATEGADDQSRRNWVELLRLLRRYRGRRPLDGLVVVVPADDLLSLSEDELQDQASNVREVVDLLHAELQFRFPVYLLVTKSDLVEGFTEFFRGLPAQRRHEILGWSHADPARRADVRRLIGSAFSGMIRRLDDYRLEMVARMASTRRARRLFFFPEEFRRLERPLQAFAETFFLRDPSGDTPVFRGVYFSSGTQGEGSPVAQAMAQFAKAIGIAPAQAAEAEEEREPKRSYFLLELFRDLMAGDQGLVSHTRMRWWRQRRNTMLGIFLPAGVAALFLLLSVIAFFLNRGLYRTIERETPGLVQELNQAAMAASAGETAGQHVVEALAASGRLRDSHRGMTGFSVLRRFGMRRPGALDEQVFGFFRQGFRDAVLEPTLNEAQTFATDSQRSCLERIDVLHSVIWLRMGRRAQWADDLQGFDRLWQLPPDQVLQAREELLAQFGYLKDRVPEGEGLLPGFSIYQVARSIRQECDRQGATSSLAMYHAFQESCASAVTPAEIQDCYARLREILRYEQQDYVTFQNHFQDLKEDLASLQGIEAEAGVGLELLQEIDLARIETGECLTRFSEQVVPEIRDYADQEDLLQDCRDAVGAISGRGEQFRERDRVLKEQEGGLAETREGLEDRLLLFSNECKGSVPGFRRLEMTTLDSVLNSYRRVACLPLEETVPVAPAPRVVTADLQWFMPPDSVDKPYMLLGWRAKKDEWTSRLAGEAGFDESQMRYEESQVRQEVADYAGEFARAWKDYLQSIELKAWRGSTASWLRSLSTTPEYALILAEAGTATSIGQQASEYPFDILAQKLVSFAGLKPFVDAKLPEYQQLLGEVAQHVERCQTDTEFFRTYQGQVARGDEAASLVKARQWVRTHAAMNLAEGSLQDLLDRPLEAARSFVLSDNLLTRLWGELQTFHAREVRGHFPFSGGVEDEPVPLETLVAFLGGQSGLVTQVSQAAQGKSLGPQARAWLEQAVGFSQVLFEPGSDDLRKLRVVFTVGTETYSPEELSKKVRVDKLRLYLGQTADFSWAEGDPRTQHFDVDLYGENASDSFSEVSASISLRKGFLGRMVSGNWKDDQAQRGASTAGAWAPLRVLVQGTAPAEGSGTLLRYQIPLASEGEELGSLQVEYHARSEELERALALARDGLPALPESGR